MEITIDIPCPHTLSVGKECLTLLTGDIRSDAF